MNFYIFNCNGHIVGNPKGYATHASAHRQANSTKTPAGRAIWAARFAAGGGAGRLWAIATMETAKIRGYTK
jgi:hypothetical protein